MPQHFTFSEFGNGCFHSYLNVFIFLDFLTFDTFLIVRSQMWSLELSLIPGILLEAFSCFLHTRTPLQQYSVSLAWRLDREVRRRLILHTIGYNESLQHPTSTVLLIKILLFFFRLLSSVYLFQSNQ